MAEEDLTTKIYTSIRYDTLQEGEYYKTDKKLKSATRSFNPDKAVLYRGANKSLLDTDDSFVFSSSTADTIGSFGHRMTAEESLRNMSETWNNIETVKNLEKLLSETYNGDVIITKITQLPVTRKKVKEVMFLLNNRMSKVWLFKADPKNTARELAVYNIAYEEGIPTGKPIGFTPGKNLGYNFDIAILGGIVEHAGESYAQLIKNMELRPDFAQKAALIISEMISNYQHALTKATAKFNDYNIILKDSGPRKEINERMIATLKNTDIKMFDELIGNCEALYSLQSPYRLVSHGDTHDHNIITLLQYDKTTSQNATLADKFGIIDWGSICVDHPYSDLINFWVHHKRLAKSTFTKYDYHLTDIISHYNKTSPLLINPDDAIIQYALWNIYEMFDPVRSDKKEIAIKADYHHAQANRALKTLQNRGYVPAIGISRELDRIYQEFNNNKNSIHE